MLDFVNELFTLIVMWWFVLLPTIIIIRNFQIPLFNIFDIFVNNLNDYIKYYLKYYLII